MNLYMEFVYSRVPNEIAVKWFEMVHFGLPMCALAAFFAPLRLTERSDIMHFGLFTFM